MIGWLEVLQDFATCEAQFEVSMFVEDAAVDEGRLVAYAVFGGMPLV
jgi:hypothetical protein